MKKLTLNDYWFVACLESDIQEYKEAIEDTENEVLKIEQLDTIEKLFDYEVYTFDYDDSFEDYVENIEDNYDNEFKNRIDEIIEERENDCLLKKEDWISLNVCEDILMDFNSKIYSIEKQINKINEVIELFSKNGFEFNAETSSKSISTYLKFEDSSKFESIITFVNEGLPTKFEVEDNTEEFGGIETIIEDEEELIIRISDHQVGEFFNQYLGYSQSYSTPNVNIEI